MSRVITFSRVYPSYHPRKGEETYFVEKLLLSLNNGLEHIDKSYLLGKFLPPKHHTIRAGNRWKVGDKFSPRVWSDKPYRSKQIILAPDIEIKKIWDFSVKKSQMGNLLFFSNLIKTDIFNCVEDETISLISKNDGLDTNDFYDWFKPYANKTYEVECQIICWNDKISYS